MERYLGVLAALLAFTLWGFLPIYWKGVDTVPALEVLCHRMAWSLIYTGAVVFLCGRGRTLLTELKSLWTIIPLSVSSILLAVNWLIYIWAVNSGYIVEASLGYFINPLINVLFGFLFFGERLRRTQCGALFFAALGVLFLTFYYGEFPWIALTLSLCFAVYGVIHKKVTVAALDALCIETMVLFFPALFYLLYGGYVGESHFVTEGVSVTLLLMGTGFVTSLPLLLFGVATQRLPLTTVGLIQYLAPSISLCLGIYLYNEPFPLERLVGFVLIWFGILLYMGENFYRRWQGKQRSLL